MNAFQEESGKCLTVVGLGKIGLPFAVQAASSGWKVIGCDVSQEVVDIVNSGHPHFLGEPGLANVLGPLVSSGKLHATTDTASSVAKSDVIVVIVPVIIDGAGSPDFRAIDAATSEVAKGLKAGAVVCYETTLPVGTTRNRFGKMLAEISKLKSGLDFHLAFSPERVSSGSILQNFSRYPKLVGGIDQESEFKAGAFYSSIFDFEERPELKTQNGVWMLGSSEAAELAKLAETTYRDVNIALANQFAIYAETIGVDIYSIIQACNSQPFSHIHEPGVSVGGHCIPVYPHLYLMGDPGATIVSAARAVNKQMPAHAVDLVERELGSIANAHVAVLGLSYRGGVKESAFSGTWDLVKEITARGGIPLVHDPLYSQEEIRNLGLTPFNLGALCDAAIVHTGHNEYQNLAPADLLGVRVVVDGRNITRDDLRNQIKTYVLGIGE